MVQFMGKVLSKIQFSDSQNISSYFLFNWLASETTMGHISVYRRMLIWGIGTLVCLVGAVKLALVIFGLSTEGITSIIVYLSLFLGGLVGVIINETVFGLRRSQLEIDRDEVIKNKSEKHVSSPTILAICPKCKNRIPSESKYCPECGESLQV